MAKKNKCLMCNKKRQLVPFYTSDKEAKSFIIVFVCEECRDKAFARLMKVGDKGG